MMAPIRAKIVFSEVTITPEIQAYKTTIVVLGREVVEAVKRLRETTSSLLSVRGVQGWRQGESDFVVNYRARKM